MDDTKREDEVPLGEVAEGAGDEGFGGEGPEMRPCKFCGAETDSRAYRCRDCGGHVALAWGTVHKEQFLFLFSAVFIGIGCLAPWDAGRPGKLYGISTIRGSMMLGLAAYGVFVAMLNIHHRRMVVWPFFLNALVALWTGLEVVFSVIGGADWNKRIDESKHLLKFLDGVKAIPPGMLMLVVAGLLVMIALLKGVIAGFMGGAAKAKSGQRQAAERRSRRRERGGGTGTGDAGAGDASAPPPPPPTDGPGFGGGGPA